MMPSWLQTKTNGEQAKRQKRVATNDNSGNKKYQPPTRARAQLSEKEKDSLGKNTYLELLGENIHHLGENERRPVSSPKMLM